MAEPAAADRLDLADWRRRVSDLYATVRTAAADDPAGAWTSWRDGREWLFREHPQSPVPAAERGSFRARHWPYQAGWRFEVTLAAEMHAGAPLGTSLGLPRGVSLDLPISTGGLESFTRIGRLAIPFAAGERTLGLYWMAGYAGGLFLPFRDATNGRETYAAGRYLLDTAKSADLGPGATPRSLILDFNFAFHPSCAFDPQWSCPLAPPENRLDIPIEAGERLA